MNDREHSTKELDSLLVFENYPLVSKKTTLETPAGWALYPFSHALAQRPWISLYFLHLRTSCAPEHFGCHSKN
ncbi:hypothetical protein EMIT0P228_10655 [Pseudomonas brassicacearum]